MWTSPGVGSELLLHRFVGSRNPLYLPTLSSLMTLRSTLQAFGLVAAILVPILGAQAQSVRIGYLDPDIIIVQMPEYALMRDSLQTRDQIISGDLQAREDILRAKFEELQQFAQSAVASQEAQQAREDEILSLQNQLVQAEAQGRSELAQRESQMLQPLLMRLQEAIDAVAGEMDLMMVFSARANNAPVILFASEDAFNITEQVLANLGLEISDSEAGN